MYIILQSICVRVRSSVVILKEQDPTPEMPQLCLSAQLPPKQEREIIDEKNLKNVQSLVVWQNTTCHEEVNNLMPQALLRKITIVNIETKTKQGTMSK